MNLKWDTNKYNSNFSFVPQYGSDVIELIKAPKGSSVLDLGCGSGVLTNELKSRGFEAKGIDTSVEFLDKARETYPELEFLEGDARDFRLEEPVDVVFSNAVLHWIKKEDQKRVVKSVYNALNKNGEFVFECGGYGCTKRIHETLEDLFSDYGYDYIMPFYFPTIGEYATLLENNGFKVTFATLFDRPTKLLGEDGLKDWIEMFIKSPFLGVEEDTRKEIINRAVERLKPELYVDKKWIADYVRLRMKAQRI